VDLAVSLHVARRPLRARNVACLLPGAAVGARDTAIVFAAHYDHLGIGAPDARGDSIYNGFSDNAAGVGMLLAIAQAMARSPGEPMRHSVVFLFPTAEELGLLGSDYYVAHPLWPLVRTAAVIALDAGAPPAPPTSWRIAGGIASPLGTLAVDVALAHGWSATVSPATPNSDYYPFARSGVPAVMIIPGPGPYEGLSTDSSVALRETWNHYHEPADAWADDFPFRGLGRYAEYALLVARAWDRKGRRDGRAPERR
jgi:Zn-dependent M28 family amino/carboxypeptidase